MRTLALVVAACLLAAPAQGYESGEDDPLERVNRGTHWLNDRFDVLLLEPIAKGWEFLTPEVVRIRVGKFFTNLRFPVRLVGSALQAKFGASAEETGRFVVNTTVGVLGFYDPATGLGLGFHDEDFGQALGSWGTPAGPYLVLPFFGPSNPRDALGLAVDFVLSGGTLLEGAGAAAVTATRVVNARALALEDVREMKEGALDYYVFLRNGYIQLREAKIRDGEVAPEEPGDDLYEIEDE